MAAISNRFLDVGNKLPGFFQGQLKIPNKNVYFLIQSTTTLSLYFHKVGIVHLIECEEEAQLFYLVQQLFEKNVRTILRHKVSENKQVRSLDFATPGELTSFFKYVSPFSQNGAEFWKESGETTVTFSGREEDKPIFDDTIKRIAHCFPHLPKDSFVIQWQRAAGKSYLSMCDTPPKGPTMSLEWKSIAQINAELPKLSTVMRDIYLLMKKMQENGKEGPTLEQYKEIKKLYERLVRDSPLVLQGKAQINNPKEEQKKPPSQEAAKSCILA